MKGKIIKGIAGFYYVHVENHGTYECKAKGIFRNKKVKPLVGDDVNMDVIDEEKLLGNISEILPRRNYVLRPEVANVDQAVIIFAVREPEPNINLLTRFIVRMQMEHVDTVICFNKTDIGDEKRTGELQDIFAESGCPVIFTSTYEERGLDSLRQILKGKTTVLAGPSGVGKSSITNRINPALSVKTGEISEKIQRGKHTTRHSELFYVEDNTYIMDTPGFTTLYMNEIPAEELRYYFHEFDRYEGKCRFHGCVHINEPDCAVKRAVSEGKIHKIRYQNYQDIYQELKSIRRY